MKNSKLVYSTIPDETANSDEKKEVPSGISGTAYIERDRKKRKGKVVTVISGLVGDLKKLQKELQKECGAGGTVKSGLIEIQGDHRDKIASILNGKGIKYKFKGG
jgi:translation initiation factor 1